jgi:hypothetical protein
MADHVTVTISERLYRRALESARLRQRPIDTVIEEALEQGLSSGAPDTETMSPDDEETAVRREMAAFLELHPSLHKQYSGQHVAIHDGRLVDHDADAEALYRRISARYPDEFVWLAPVADEPLPTLHFRSPRLVGAR